MVISKKDLQRKMESYLEENLLCIEQKQKEVFMKIVQIF